MTKYQVYSYEDEPLQYLVSGGHFNGEKAINILLNKKIIDTSDNLKVSDISFGWGRKATEEDKEEAQNRDITFVFHQGDLNIPYGYNTKVTFVELIEENVEKLKKGK